MTNKQFYEKYEPVVVFQDGKWRVYWVEKENKKKVRK